MALIECPECGQNVSDRANACPNCGYPISAMIAKQGNDMGLKELSKSNRLKVLNINPRVDACIREKLKENENSAYLITCHIINEYFDGVKHNRLNEIFGPAFLIFLGISESQNSNQDTIDQAALYYNLYPNSSKKLFKDMMEYYSMLELESALQRLILHAKEEDGAYEEMLRKQGIVEPF